MSKHYFECPFCDDRVTEFEADYEDEFPGTYSQDSRYICVECGAAVTIYEAGYENVWEPPENWDKPIPAHIII